MAENKKLVPKRRFKGFTDEWNMRTIGEFGNFYYGKSAPKWSVTADATIPCVRYGELYTKHSEKIDKIYSYTNILKEDLKFSRGEEVLVPRVGEDPLDFANCTWLSISGVAIGEMISVYNTKQNSLFTAYMFNALLKYEFAKRVEGGNVSNLYYTYLEDIPVSYPIVDEQEKISQFLDDLSKLIAHHQRKLEKTKALKQAYLLEMFPAGGESKPKLRFKGFTDEWEECILNNKVEFFSGLTYSPNNIIGSDGTLVLRSSNVQKGRIKLRDNVYVDSSVVNSDNVRLGDIILVVRNGSRNLIGKHAQIKYSMKNTVIGAFMTGIRSLQPDFLNSLLDTKQFKVEIEKNLGATINQITTGDLKKMIFMFPKPDEQQKIGSFFRNLDDLISLHQRKLEKLQDIKKAYLNEMFI